MTFRSTVRCWCAAAAALAAMACGGAAVPTPELANARVAYTRMCARDTADLSPEGVSLAQQALLRAEELHRRYPGSDAERSASYVAQRRAELALVLAQEVRDQYRHKRADLNYRRAEEIIRAREAGRLP